MAEGSLTDLELAEDELLENYLLGNGDELDDEDGPTIEEIMEETDLSPTKTFPRGG